MIYWVPLDSNREVRIDPQSRVVLKQPTSGNWRLDLENGKWDQPSKAALASVPDPSSPIWLECLDKVVYDDRPNRWRARILTTEGKSEREVVDFDFVPRPRALGDHFVIGHTPTTWYILDLRDSSQQIHELAPASSLQPFVVADSNRFYELDESVATGLRLVLYEVLEGGLPRQVAAWPIGTQGADPSREGLIVTLSPDRLWLESRTLATGELVARQPVPAGVDPQSTEVYSFEWFVVEELMNAAGHRYEKIFDLETGQALALPQLQLTGAPRLKEHGLWMFNGYAPGLHFYVCVYDVNRHQIVFQMQAGATSWGGFLDEQRILYANRSHGLTAKVFDLNTHQTLATYRPWWWASPLLVACCIGFAVWVYMWVQAGVTDSRWVWCDVALFALLGIVPLLLRVEAVGGKMDIDRPVFAYAQGIFLALTHLCGVWIVFGQRTRWLLRTVPMVLVLSLLLVVLTRVFLQPKTGLLFYSPSDLAWEGLATTAIPTAISMLGFGALRLARFRLHIDRTENTDRDKNVSQLPLRDLFVAITCAGLLLAATKPLILALPRGTPNVAWDLIATVACATIGHNVALVLAFANDRRLVRLGTVLLSSLFVALVAIPIVHFAEWIPPTPQAVRWAKFFIVSAMSWVWFYVFLRTYRHRSRLSWARVVSTR